MFLRSRRSAALKRAALTVCMAVSNCSAARALADPAPFAVRLAAIAASIEETTPGEMPCCRLDWAMPRAIGRVLPLLLLSAIRSPRCSARMRSVHAELAADEAQLGRLDQ